MASKKAKKAAPRKAAKKTKTIKTEDLPNITFGEAIKRIIKL